MKMKICSLPKKGERKRLMFAVSIADATTGNKNAVDIIHMTTDEALTAIAESDGSYELYLTMKEARAAESYYRITNRKNL